MFSDRVIAPLQHALKTYCGHGATLSGLSPDLQKLMHQRQIIGWTVMGSYLCIVAISTKLGPPAIPIFKWTTFGIGIGILVFKAVMTFSHGYVADMLRRRIATREFRRQENGPTVTEKIDFDGAMVCFTLLFISLYALMTFWPKLGF